MRDDKAWLMNVFYFVFPVAGLLVYLLTKGMGESERARNIGLATLYGAIVQGVGYFLFHINGKPLSP